MLTLSKPAEAVVAATDTDVNENYVTFVSTLSLFDDVDVPGVNRASTCRQLQRSGWENPVLAGAKDHSGYVTNTSCTSPDVGQVLDSNQNVMTSSDSAIGCRSRVRLRKQSAPRRCASADDPKFRGVIVRMANVYDGHSYKLHVRSEFRLSGTSNTPSVAAHRTKSNDQPISSSNTSHVTSGDSQSDSEPYIYNSNTGNEADSVFSHCLLEHLSPFNVPIVTNLPLRYYANKECASCNVRRTPLWRDAEDGTPLCNACGIRYKKYRIRCVGCWNVPRKESKPLVSSFFCQKCGDVLKLSVRNKTSSM